MTAGGEQVGSERCGRTDLRGRLHVRTVSAPPAFKDTGSSSSSGGGSLPLCALQIKTDGDTETERASVNEQPLLANEAADYCKVRPTHTELRRLEATRAGCYTVRSLSR